MRLVWDRLKLVVEPSGAVALAALIAGRDGVGGLRIGVILSGGNVDLDRLPWQEPRFRRELPPAAGGSHDHRWATLGRPRQSTVLGYYNAFNRGDWKGMLALLSRRRRARHQPGTHGRGREPFAKFLEHMARCYREELRNVVVMSTQTAAASPPSSWSTASTCRPTKACRRRGASATCCRRGRSSSCRLPHRAGHELLQPQRLVAAGRGGLSARSAPLGSGHSRASAPGVIPTHPRSTPRVSFPRKWESIVVLAPLTYGRHPRRCVIPAHAGMPVARRTLRSEALAAHCFSLRRPRFVRPAAGRAEGDFACPNHPLRPQRAPREVAARTSCARGPREKTPARGPPNNSGIHALGQFGYSPRAGAFSRRLQGPRCR